MIKMLLSKSDYERIMSTLLAGVSTGDISALRTMSPQKQFLCLPLNVTGCYAKYFSALWWCNHTPGIKPQTVSSTE